MEYIKGKTPLFISLKKSVKENGILRSQTSVFYFSYKVINNPAIFEDFRGFSEDFARLPKMSEDVPTTC